MPNDDYIKRSDAVFAVQKRIEQIGMGNNPLVCSIRQAVRDVPAADVEPVRHGKWVYDSDHIPHCSECGTIALQRHKLYLKEKIYDVPFVLSKRCPVCDAKMDAEPPKEGEDDI